MQRTFDSRGHWIVCGGIYNARYSTRSALDLRMALVVGKAGLLRLTYLSLSYQPFSGQG